MPAAIPSAASPPCRNTWKKPSGACANCAQQADDPNVGQRQKKARERAAREKLERVQAALKANDELAADREARKKGDGPKTRTSTTDPDARKMQMSDGGFRPAHNVQFATTADTKIIVGVDVINQGNDAGQIQPMIEQVQERLGAVPDQHLVDGGYSTKKDIEETAKLGTTVYAPVKEQEQQEAKGQDPFQPKKGDKPAVAAWRIRMGTAAAKELYKRRGETAEWVNACMRQRGMQQFWCAAWPRSRRRFCSTSWPTIFCVRRSCVPRQPGRHSAHRGRQEAHGAKKGPREAKEAGLAGPVARSCQEWKPRFFKIPPRREGGAASLAITHTLGAWERGARVLFPVHCSRRSCEHSLPSPCRE